MDTSRAKRIRFFQDRVACLAEKWRLTGLPSRQRLEEVAQALVRWRVKEVLPGIWRQPPTLATATLDDAVGQGLKIIESYAEAIGMRLSRLGLMQTPAAIIGACQRIRPDFLGLTILQFDTEETLLRIAGKLPRHTRIIAGGPLFKADPEFADRSGIHVAVENVTDFLLFMLTSARDDV